MNCLYGIKDFIARNRAKIGGLGLALWMALQANAGYQEWAAQHRMFDDLVVAAVAYITGSGAHKSDSYQRDKQGK